MGEPPRRRGGSRGDAVRRVEGFKTKRQHCPCLTRLFRCAALPSGSGLSRPRPAWAAASSACSAYSANTALPRTTPHLLDRRIPSFERG